MTKPSFFGTRSVVEGIPCQSATEALILKNLLKTSKVERGLQIKTPFGSYTPDFKLTDHNVLVECKSLGTWRICCGVDSIMPNARIDSWSQLSTKQLQKICWVHENISPVKVVVMMRPRDKRELIKVESLDVFDVHMNLLEQESFNLISHII